MSKIFTIALLVITFSTHAKGYQLTINSDSCFNEEIILARYYGTTLYPVDTAQCSTFGKATFLKNQDLDQGLYALIIPNKFKNDLLIADNQNLEIRLTSDKNTQLLVTGDKQSEAFSAYSEFMRSMQTKREKTIKRYKVNAENKDSVSVLKKELESLNHQVKNYYSSGISQFNGQLLGAIFNVLSPQQAPNVLSIDQQRMFQKNHFLDPIDFHDDRLVNTPFIINQVDVYLNQIVDQNPDSLVKYALKLVDKSTVNDAMFRQVCNQVFSFATKSKIMGMDKLQVALSQRYYLSGMAYWTNPTFIKKLTELVDKVEPILIGKEVPDVNLFSIHDKDGFISLKDIDARFTLLFFWEPNCYHCQQAIPHVKKVGDKYPSSTLSIYAVNTQFDVQVWKDYVFENDLYGWINVIDKNNQSNHKHTFDVASTPMLYLLDKDKIIVAKKFDAKFLEVIMKQLISSDKIH